MSNSDLFCKAVVEGCRVQTGGCRIKACILIWFPSLLFCCARGSGSPTHGILTCINLGEGSFSFCCSSYRTKVNSTPSFCLGWECDKTLDRFLSWPISFYIFISIWAWINFMILQFIGWWIIYNAIICMQLCINYILSFRIVIVNPKQTHS